MAKSRLEEMASRVKAAAPGIGGGVASRLEHAEALLLRQPTGFPETNANQANTQEGKSADGRRIYFLRVPLDNIDPNPFNARQIYIPERIYQLSQSIRTDGQLMPGVATLREGRTILAAGHYRWKAIKLGLLPTMDLMIHEGLTDRELYKISFKENEERNQQTPLDNALSWRKLIDESVYLNESAIADVTGLSLPNVNKTMAILRLSEPILELVRQRPGNFAMSTLYELVLLEGVAGQSVALEMAHKVGAEEFGRKEVSELRARFETPKDRKRKENSRQYKININGQQTGFIKEWDSGKVALEINLPDHKDREALVNELKLRFNLGDN